LKMRENISLAPFTTLGIGGPARWFAEAASEEEILEASGWARQRGVPLFVLGGGSNVLIADDGFDGLVLRVALCGIRAMPGNDRRSEPGEPRIYQVAAGESWDSFVERAVQDHCAGIECLAGIPGTVGGTPVQNVGAYGQEVASAIERVRAIDLKLREFAEFSIAECGFGYRRSRFNTTDRGRYVVTRVDYRLIPGGTPMLHYADVQREMNESRDAGDEPSLSEVAGAVRRIRRRKGMLLVEGDPDCRSAGSFFKNPVISNDQFKAIAECGGGTPPSFSAGTGTQSEGCVKIPAAWLIEQAGFAKGYSLGAAGISTKHTLAIVNRGGATAEAILALANQIASAVDGRFGIRLEMEPERVGFERQGLGNRQ
jgi:UDP-N-acetylmuramate dehydrogenase